MRGTVESILSLRRGRSVKLFDERVSLLSLESSCVSTVREERKFQISSTFKNRLWEKREEDEKKITRRDS